MTDRMEEALAELVMATNDAADSPVSDDEEAD